jgi:hypothetical protein
MAKSELIAMERNGIIKKLQVLNQFETGSGLVDRQVNYPREVVIRGIKQYADNSFNDNYGVEMAQKLLGGNGVSVLSASRENRQATFEINISTAFKQMLFSVKFPHKEY